MGATRKLLSICTGGIIDFRSDKERVARSARKTLHETRRHNRWERRQAQQAPRAVLAGTQGPPLPPAGWYQDQAGVLRWWDGQRWTASTAPLNGPGPGVLPPLGESGPGPAAMPGA